MTERTAAKPAKKRISPAKPRRQRRGKPTHSQISERAYFIHLEQRVARRARRGRRHPPGHHRDVAERCRNVAALGHAHELLAQAEGDDDVGGSRKERDDAHRTSLRAESKRPRDEAGPYRGHDGGGAIAVGQAGLSAASAARAAPLSVNHVALTAV